MKTKAIALAALAVAAGLALAAPPPPGGGAPPGGAPPGKPPGGAPPGGPPGGRPPGGPAPGQGHHPGGGGGYWYGPRVGFYFGSPYWWGGPGAYWPGYYWPGYYGYGYAPPAYVVGPPGVVTSTGGVVYIEREQGTLSTQPATPDAAAAPGVAPPAPASPAPGTHWWYLCTSPRGAYPYVRECPGGWERVPAVPPGQTQ